MNVTGVASEAAVARHGRPFSCNSTSHVTALFRLISIVCFILLRLLGDRARPDYTNTAQGTDLVDRLRIRQIV